jgi:hypothetical protein
MCRGYPDPFMVRRPCRLEFRPSVGRVRPAGKIMVSLFFGLVLFVSCTDLLQVVAWTGMLIVRSQTSSLSDAIHTTFDGQHPCPMCRMIQDQHQDSGTPTPTRQDLALKVIKVALLEPDGGFMQPTQWTEALTDPMDEPVMIGMTVQPPVPPPRA